MRSKNREGVTIDGYTQEDAPEWVSLINTIRTNPLSLEQFAEREALAERPKALAMLVCRTGGGIVAIGQLNSSPYVPERFARLDMVVSEKWRCIGIGSGLLEALEGEARRQELSGLYCEDAEHHQQTAQWLLRRGFGIFRRRRESHLLLDTDNSSAQIIPRLPATVRTVSFPDSQLGSEQLLQFIGARLQETPDLQGLPAWSSEQLHAIFLDNPAAPKDWIVLAMKADQPIGVGVMHEQGPEAYIYFVGVDDHFRASSVGTAIFSELVNSAKRRGCKAVNIDNMESNIAAIRLTEKLGFMPIRKRIEFRKSL